MNVLDIDIDAFLDPRPKRRANDDRLSSTEYRPWARRDVKNFLADRCILHDPKPGDIVTYHHELFDRWNSMIASGQLRVPFHLTHVDSHADMGMGDASSSYIMGELLHQNPKDRNNPKRGGHDGLLEGNFISFAVACGWISSIDYVHHPQLFAQNCGLHDIPDCLFRDNDPKCGVIQLKQLPPDCRQSIRRLQEFTPLAFEPEVPIRFIERDAFHTDALFSFIFVAKSPKYTPATSDSIVDIIREFIIPN